MDYNYYLTYKHKRRQGELYFNVGSKDKPATLLRLKGRNTSKIFQKILSTLSRAGCITPIETGKSNIYWIRDDVGPVIGAYLILIRQCRNLDYWLNFLDELLTGEYSQLGEIFAITLEFTIELSKHSFVKSKRKAYELSPAIISSFSSSLKTFVKSLKKYENQSENRSKI